MGVLERKSKRSCLAWVRHDVYVVRHQTKPDDRDSMQLGALAEKPKVDLTLSIALNSNALNVTVGLLLPGVLVGLGAPSGQGTLVAAWYLGLTVVTLGCAYTGRGLRRCADLPGIQNPAGWVGSRRHRR